MSYQVIDLFAGAGGFGLGFQMAGYKLELSIEKDKWACDTIRANCNHNVIEAEIQLFNTENKILNAISQSVDIIIGGPPCQGFSISGPRKLNDPRNELYSYFLDWVKILCPKIFIIENVIGITRFKKSKDKKLLIDEIRERCTQLGYELSIWTLNAKDYGVPQNRIRVFLVGHLGQVKIPPPPNTHGNGKKLFINVGDAILDLPFIEACQGSEVMNYTYPPNNSYQIWARKNSKLVYNHEAMKHTKRIVKRYENIINGNDLSKLEDDLKVRKRNGNGILSDVKFSQNYRHLKLDSPSFTIPAHFYSSFIHPNVPRNITTREAARLQSFPDDYVFLGKRTMLSKNLLNKKGEKSFLSQYNQVGNAVPPLLSKQIARHLKKYL